MPKEISEEKNILKYYEPKKGMERAVTKILNEKIFSEGKSISYIGMDDWNYLKALNVLDVLCDPIWSNP